MTNPLNPKQLAFCREYVIDSNGTQAAIRAGYSPRTANEQASQLLAKLNIQQEVARLRNTVAAQCELTAEWVIRRLMDEALHGDKPSARVKALELLARTRGMLIDRVISETRPLYDESAYDSLLSTETIDALPVRPNGLKELLPDAASCPPSGNGYHADAAPPERPSPG